MVAVEPVEPIIEERSGIDPEDDRLWETWEHLKLPPGSRAEILRGAIVVSPSPMNLHNLLFALLVEQLVPKAKKLGWAITNTESIRLHSTGEAVIPDLVAAPKKALYSGKEWLLNADEVELVVEITSASTRDRDLTWKLESYGKAQIPIYVIVDRLDGDGTVTVYHEPDGDGKYKLHQTVGFGTKLWLPEPFDIEIDTSEFTEE